MNKNFKKNQKVYLKKLSGYSNGKFDIIPTMIKAIGRKYITVNYGDLQFYKDTLREHTTDGTSSTYFLYISLEVLEKEQKRKEKLDTIRFKFSDLIRFSQIKDDITDEDLDTIYNIIKKYL